MMTKRVGLIGLGDMGIGMAKNIVESGFELTGFDLRPERLTMLEELGAKAAHSPQEVGANADAVFIMVMNGQQVDAVVNGDDGLLQSMASGSTIIVSATIEPKDVRAVEPSILAKGVHMIDTPVSGGKSGADGGTLTMMTAAPRAVFDDNLPVLQAVGENIVHVGEEIGLGQTVKASLQAYIGASFTAIFESLVLGAKAGVPGKVMLDVFGTSSAGSPLFRNCAELIMNREFKGTGSHIGTMYKDLGISMNMAKENGVAMFTAAAAYELFRSGISLFPEEDNWSIVKLLEQIADTEVRW
jgi:3-hydroxyisobutyrate dehydrogenase-like beta-hydroxyacid dehydrogenase